MSEERFDIDWVIARIRTLQQHMHGNRFPHEIETFAAKIQELITKYNISEMQLDEFGESATSPVGETWAYPSDGGFDWPVETARPQVWAQRLARAVANAHFCRALAGTNANITLFVGREIDRQTAKYTFLVLARAAERLCAQEYAAARADLERGGEWRRGQYNLRDFRPTFLRAFVLRIEQRYAETSKALEITHGQALVVRDKSAQANDEFIRQHYPGVQKRNVPALQRVNDLAAARGRHHADRMNLRPRGIDGGDERKDIASPRPQLPPGSADSR